jgi:cellulose synthase/poly-beta-1,6-N-acetylglucosamine synthase-like glycosyltransferase
MSGVITAALIVIIAPLLLLTAFFSVEVIAGLPANSCERRTAPAASAVIVVPAHDEAAIIERTLSELKAAAGPRMRILVVADNCSDGTADCARRAGAEVIERIAPDKRGKGYALAFAAEALESCRPDVFVVLDADCSTDMESLHSLVSAAARSDRPCQAVNLLRPDRTARPFVQISGFAFMIKNLIRQRGLERLCGRAHLTGTGMAFPFALVSSALLANGDIVEDLALGLEMSARGHPPRLVSNALVLSDASAPSDTLLQRRRWEGGFLATSLRRSPEFVVRAFRMRDFRLLVAALDLMVPPLALLSIVNFVALALLAAAVTASGSSWAPVVADALLLSVAGALVFLAWLTRGREYVSFAVLAGAPLYVAWKIPLYLSLARRGAPREWLRTRR